MIVLDLNTGLRRNELFSLKPNNVDFPPNVIRVLDTKNAEDREVEMNQTARAVLVTLVAHARANHWEYVFTTPRTGTRYKDVRKGFKNALRDAGIQDLWLHDLRHTFASLAGDSPEVTLSALAEIMGHKGVKTTMRYTHPSKERRLKVVQAQETAEKENHKSATTTRGKPLDLPLND